MIIIQYNTICRLLHGPALAMAATLPASCSWIFSSSIGVVTTIWQKPALPPAAISRNRVSFLPTTDHDRGAGPTVNTSNVCTHTNARN